MTQQRFVVIFDGRAVERHDAAARILQPGHDAQQGRFAAARRADERQAVDAVEFEIHPVDHRVRAEPLHHILQAKFHT